MGNSWEKNCQKVEMRERGKVCSERKLSLALSPRENWATEEEVMGRVVVRKK